jgi:hypothetical protein
MLLLILEFQALSNYYHLLILKTLIISYIKVMEIKMEFNSINIIFKQIRKKKANLHVVDHAFFIFNLLYFL